MRSRNFILLTLALSASLSPFILAQAGQTPQTAGQQAAEPWLALIDAGKYPESWEATAQLFKSKVSKEQWTSAIQSLRKPLGQFASRKIKSATYTTSLPDAPEGEYVLLEYDSSFESKKSVLEAVTLILEKDGKWRAVGYFIQ